MPAEFQSPSVIETLDYEVIVSAMVADAASRLALAGISYDVGNLEVDPVKIVIEADAARELLLRARINDAALTRVLPYAAGSDLDYLASFYGVARLADEADARLRKRVTLAISGRSTAGPADWYVSAAMRASIRVKEAMIYRTGIGPELVLSILATDNGGVADAPLIAAVDAEVQKNSVRVISDRITVISAVKTIVNVAAEVWLLPDASQTIIAALEPQLRAAFEAEGGLGFDLKRSWLASRLHQPGVARVNLTGPAADVIVSPNGAVAIGTVTITYMGRDR
jgi:phage-related baseplate assembly protein